MLASFSSLTLLFIGLDDEMGRIKMNKHITAE